MVGNIVNIVEQSSQIDPDSCFDPNTHIATEENFIKFLKSKTYDSKYIGYKVILSNSTEYNNGIWIIADVNHDSINTGQNKCYDLISDNVFNYTNYDNSSNEWRKNNVVRPWLNGNFYNGFNSVFKTRMIKPKYNSQGSWYADDYIIIPSKVEINGGIDTYTENEGIVYPIFTGTSGTDANNSRIKKLFQNGYTTSMAYGWWTRSRKYGTTNPVWRLVSDGSMSTSHYKDYKFCIAPLLRVH